MTYIEKFKSSELVDLGNDVAEIAIDSILDEGLLKELPVIKTVFTLYKTGKSVKDQFTLRKILSFLNGCNGLSKEETEEFIQNFENEKKSKEFGMQLLLLIDKTDDIKKAELIGKLFLLLLKKTFDLKVYLRLCYMINKCFYDDILCLQYFKDSQSILTSNNEIVDAIVLENLFSSGLLSEYGFDGGDASGKNGGTRYALNDYGMKLKTVL